MVEASTVAEVRHRGLPFKVFVTSLSLFNFGYNTASIGGALLYIEPSDTGDCRSNSVCLVSSFEKGYVVSSCLLGAILGALLAGSLADRFGRRNTLLLNNFFYIVGPVGMFYSLSVDFLAAARFVAGIGVGVSSALVHVYISEVVPAARRGGHGAILVMMGSGGILAANLAAYWLADRWRLTLGVAAVPAALQALLGPLVLPESRRCLQDNSWRRLWIAVRTGAARRPLIVGIGLQVLQQISGINVEVYYAPTIFKLAGFTDAASVFLSAAVSLVQMMATLLLAGIVDHVGRRPMCFLGLIFMIASLVLLGISFLFTGTGAGWLALGAVLLYRVAFSVSLGPMPYIITAEIFPGAFRAAGVSLCWAMNWSSNFIVSLTFLPLTEVTTVPGTFFMYAAVCIFAVWFVYHQVPETTGRTLEELEQLGSAAPMNTDRDREVADGGAGAGAARITVLD